MKLLKKLLFIAVGLFVLVALVGFLLPSSIRVERTKTISASPATLYAYLLSPRNFTEWSPWSGIDTTMTVEYFGPETGVGAGYTWEGEDWKVGSGRWEITGVESTRSVTVSMQFGPGDPATATFLVKPDGENSSLTWVLESNMGWNPFARYMGLFIESSVGTMYDEGLVNLNTIMAAMPTWRVANIELTTSPAFSMLSVRETIDPSAIGEMLARNYAAIIRHINTKNLEVSAPPFAIYHHWPADGVGKADVEAAIPISKPDNGTPSIKGSQFNGGRVVIAYYYGPYEQSENAHTELAEWAQDHGKLLVDAPWEVYVTDPQMEPDPTKWLTLVCYRVQDAPAL